MQHHSIYRTTCTDRISYFCSECLLCFAGCLYLDVSFLFLTKSHFVCVILYLFWYSVFFLVYEIFHNNILCICSCCLWCCSWTLTTPQCNVHIYTHDLPRHTLLFHLHVSSVHHLFWWWYFLQHQYRPFFSIIHTHTTPTQHFMYSISHGSQMLLTLCLFLYFDSNTVLFFAAFHNSRDVPVV